MVVRTRRRRSRSPAMAWAHITPCDPLVVHPRRGRCAVVELGGDPRYPLGAVCLVDPADPVGQLRIRRHPGSACRGGAQPGVERGSGDLHEFAQPLHLEGVPVIGDEPETAHQFVSPAKYFAAWRRMSRSVSSLAFSVSNAATCARNRASSASADPARPARCPWVAGASDDGLDGSGPAHAPTPAACAGRFPSPPRSLAASHPEPTDTDQQPGGGTPPCRSCGP
jgi:hypothetical protein